jgi:hypothetical protein
MRNRDAILFEALNVSGRVRAVRVIGMSDRRFPIVVWIRERGGNRVEGVSEEWVLHGGRSSIGCDDIEGLHGDTFGRRDAIFRPVPVWRSQVLGCGNPTLCINLVRVCNLDSVLLQHLLDNMAKIVMKYTMYKTVN